MKVLVLTVTREGRGYIGNDVAKALDKEGIDATRVIAVVPVLSTAFDNYNTRETSTVQVLYKGQS